MTAIHFTLRSAQNSNTTSWHHHRHRRDGRQLNVTQSNWHEFLISYFVPISLNPEKNPQRAPDFRLNMRYFDAIEALVCFLHFLHNLVLWILWFVTTCCWRKFLSSTICMWIEAFKSRVQRTYNFTTFRPPRRNFINHLSYDECKCKQQSIARFVQVAIAIFFSFGWMSRIFHCSIHLHIMRIVSNSTNIVSKYETLMPTEWFRMFTQVSIERCVPFKNVLVDNNE